MKEEAKVILPNKKDDALSNVQLAQHIKLLLGGADVNRAKYASRRGGVH